MKLSVLATALAACSTVIANPVENFLYRRADGSSGIGDPAAMATSAGAGPGSAGASAPSAPTVVPGSSLASAAGSGSPTAASPTLSGSLSAAGGSSSTVAPAAGGGSNTTAAGGGSNTTAAGGGSNTTTPIGGSNTTAAGGASNTTTPVGGGYSNTSAASGASNATSGGKIWIFVTGGTVGLVNSSDVSVVTLYNASQALNITQLYSLAGRVNDTLGQGSTEAVVIVSNEESLEPLGIFTSLVFNTDKPIIVGQNGAIGVAIARQSSASARGPLVVGENRLLYPGVFAPTGDDSSSCAAVGISSDYSNTTWFFENSVPTLIGPDSALKQNYSNFTNYDVSNAPVVPVIYDGAYANQLISSLPSASGFVLVSSGSNSTLSTVRNSSSPIVFAEAGSGLHYVGTEDVPPSTIPAGYLSPVKAQILLSVAIANNVTDETALRSLFP